MPSAPVPGNTSPKGRYPMRLLFKQRMFSWFDSYDIYYENGETAYTVKGQLSWGHCLKIYDPDGREVGTVQERVLTLLPSFEVCACGQCLGSIRKEFTLFSPRYSIDFLSWQVEGSFLEWDYTVRNAGGQTVAMVSKELLHWTDTYVIDVANPADALPALMLVLAIDAEKCSRN